MHSRQVLIFFWVAAGISPAMLRGLLAARSERCMRGTAVLCIGLGSRKTSRFSNHVPNHHLRRSILFAAEAGAFAALIHPLPVANRSHLDTNQMTTRLWATQEEHKNTMEYQPLYRLRHCSIEHCTVRSLVWQAILHLKERATCLTDPWQNTQNGRRDMS